MCNIYIQILNVSVLCYSCPLCPRKMLVIMVRVDHMLELWAENQNSFLIFLISVGTLCQSIGRSLISQFHHFHIVTQHHNICVIMTLPNVCHT